jgi:hypothetical protein
MFFDYWRVQTPIWSISENVARTKVISHEISVEYYQKFCYVLFSRRAGSTEADWRAWLEARATAHPLPDNGANELDAKSAAIRQQHKSARPPLSERRTESTSTLL